MASPTMRIAAEALKNLAKVDQAIDYYRRENLPKLQTVLENTVLSGMNQLQEFLAVLNYQIT